MMIWELGIPGKQGVSSPCSIKNILAGLTGQTNWEGGVYKVLATFPEGTSDYQYKELADDNRLPH